MADKDALIQPDRGQKANEIHLVDKAGFGDWLKRLSGPQRAAVEAQRFTAGSADIAIVPNGDGWFAAGGVNDRACLSSWCLAKLAEQLPAGAYRLAGCEAGAALLGWQTAQYSFSRYRSEPHEEGDRILLTKQAKSIEPALAEARAVFAVRDLVNTPAEDMGPSALEAEVEALAKAHGAKLSAVKGDRLESEFPMVYAVGRAASRHHAPRLIELNWGDPKAPRLALVGKGVCFDSGGLDIKPARGMELMKKDMGGAAHVIALAGLIMGAGLNLRLQLLVPAVENAVAGNAFRPGDVLKSRKGLSVEIGNTDAEGRLVLADALALADEEKPALIADFATLTGAARVAMGPELSPFFTDDDKLAGELMAAGAAEFDPVWRMPLWRPYDSMLDSKVADFNNVSSGGQAGAITAALFLRRFVEAPSWLHFDIFAWNASPKPARPEGGELMAARALFAVLKARYA